MYLGPGTFGDSTHLWAGVAVKTGVFEDAAGEHRGGEGPVSLTGSDGSGWPATRTSRLGKAV
jgi:hypothetical protein